MSELLAPSSSLETQTYAFSYGANAVYAGIPRYSLRVRNNGYDFNTIQTGISKAHEAGGKFYLTCNLYAHERKLDSFVRDMNPVMQSGPDGLIMADPGLIRLARQNWPQLPVHLSVQANTVNSDAVLFWQDAGVTRVILSRELGLGEIAAVKERCPEMELEVFVHGALCIAYSGRCLLSGYFNHRDANQGTCTNSCRWDYRLQSTDSSAFDSGETLPASEVLLAEEGERPGELMPVWEDEHGTYIFNSKDLCAVDLVKDLVDIGVDSLKIEGRTKSHYYVARTVQIYRQAIDAALAGKTSPELRLEAEKLSNRGYTTGFLQRHAPNSTQNYTQNSSDSTVQRFVAEFDHYDESSGTTVFEVKNKINQADRLELITPDGNREFLACDMLDLEGNALPEAPGGGWKIRFPGQFHHLSLIAKYL